MRKVTCMCETSFDADLPDEIDIDAKPNTIADILGGQFFSVVCPSCGSLLKPELEVRLTSKIRGLDILVIPEIERLAFYLGKKEIHTRELLIGYDELFERARMLDDGMDPDTIEIIKYYLLLKADEKAPEGAAIKVTYAGLASDGRLSFHVAGIKQDEIAVLPLARDVYSKTQADKARTVKKEPFAAIFKGPYRSIRALEAEAEVENAAGGQQHQPF